MTAPAPREPFYAKCSDCQHIWIVLYVPMTMTDAAKVFASTHCPKCAADSARITPAKQRNGVLQEPQT